MKKICLCFTAIVLLSACAKKAKDSDSATDTDSAIVDKTELRAEIVETVGPIEADSSLAYGYEMVVEGLKIPWGLEFLPDGSMMITERRGELIHFKDGEVSSVEGVPEVYKRAQGGFLDVALHPDYEENGWIYFTYASKEGEGEGANTALMRAKLVGKKLTNKEVLYKATPNTTKGIHFGSRISFDNQGYLYFSAGERGERDLNPQDITRDNGKVYRLKDDGSIPPDNPFIGEENAVEAIFSYGHRNPQGMLLHPVTGEIWVHEHGPKGGDEINIVKKGANYGWPIVTYGVNYDGTSITDERTRPEFENPIFYWLPSIAPSGFEFVTSDKFPELKGNLLVGSLKFRYLELLLLTGSKIQKRVKLLQDIGRIRDVKQGPDGNIYVAVEGKGIAKLIKTNNQ